MEELLLDIIGRLRRGESPDSEDIARIIRAHNKHRHASRTAKDARTAAPAEQDPRRQIAGAASSKPDLSKKQLIPYYQRVKRDDPARFASWDVDETLERRLYETLRIKPRRTASGVATITVITKPWPCTGGCSYCPNDILMPKSYLHKEPACQRALRAWFDPYLQVNARLTALTEMGHVTGKIELIVLGGTWDDYPPAYQRWFVRELFRALNEFGSPSAAESAAARQHCYEELRIRNDSDTLERALRGTQREIDALDLTYNDAWKNTYGTDTAWAEAASWQTASPDEVAAAQTENESADHRVVGLVFETRPNLITAETLTRMRRLGATKVQVGIQSLQPDILVANTRRTSPERIAEAFGLLRLFGFKVHAHFMANLLGATPESDKADFAQLVTDSRFRPDEIKLYPCSLIAGTQLAAVYGQGAWRPYTYDELLDVMAADVMATPPFTRISRMIRDFSASDILAGSTYANLRQRVEEAVADTAARTGRASQEIRLREIAESTPPAGDLQLDEVRYETPVTDEHFLQWVTRDGRIAGLLRLSLPHADAVAALGSEAPVGPREAMIREVHVYGKVAALGDGRNGAEGVQHAGLGKALVDRACSIARQAGYRRINVISSVGTRGYYAKLGFSLTENGLYQAKDL